MNEKIKRISSKSSNLSKKILSKKIKLAKNQTGTDFFNKKKIKKKYVIKKNFTYTNFFKHTNNFSDRPKKSNKFSLKKLSHELIIDPKYSSFISKNSKYLNSDFLKADIDSRLNSPNKTQSGFLYNNFFGKKNNINTHSDTKTRTSTSINSKSKILNLMNSPLKNDAIKPLNFRKINFNFNYDIFDTEKEGEDIKSFMKKCLFIRKEKIKKYNLENYFYYMKGKNEDEYNYIQIKNDKCHKNLSLLNKFEKSFDDYLEYLENEYRQEKNICNQLNNKKKNLEKSKIVLEKKIEKLNKELIKYKNVKRFLISAKYGFDYIKKIDNNNENSVSPPKNNNEIKKNIRNRILSKSSKSVSVELIKENNKKAQTKKYYVRKNRINKTNSSKSFLFINNLGKNVENNNNNNNINITTNSKEKEISYKNISPFIENENEFNNIFTDLEDNIINKINIFNRQAKILNRYKINLLNIKNENEKECIGGDILIESKIKKLIFLKKENKELQNIIYNIKKTSSNEGLKNNLEIQVYNMLINYNANMDIQEKLGIYNIFNLLKMKSDEFFIKKNKSKLIYMIKIIELFLEFLNNFKMNCLCDPKIRRQYENISNLIEKENFLKMKKLNKEQIKQKLKEKRINLIKKTNKIRFFSNKKYDVKFIKSNKNHSKNKLNNKNNSCFNYVDLLTYY